MSPLGGHQLPYHRVCSLQGWVPSGQMTNRERVQSYPSATGVKSCSAQPCPPEQDPVSPPPVLPSGREDQPLGLLHQRADRRHENDKPTAARTKTIYPRKLIIMKRQRVMSQIKGQDKTPEKQLNEVETDKLPEKGLRIIIMKMIQDLRKKKKREDARNVCQRPRRTKEQTNRDEQYTGRNHSRITEAEEGINDLEDRMVEITAAKQNTGKRMKKKKNEDSLRAL